MSKDLRVRYTKMFLKNNLLKLLDKKSITKITVTELCQLSQINRSTFYGHYQDIYDLFEQIETDFLNELYQMNAPLDFSSQNIEQIKFFRDICQFCLENKELYLVLNGPHGDPDFIRKLSYKVLQWTKKISITNELNYKESIEQDMAITFLFEGSYAVIYNWLKYNDDISVDKIAKTLFELNFHGINK